MRYIVFVLLLLGAQFSFTAFAPASGKAWFLWPFSNDSKPILGFIGGLPKQGGSIVSSLLAGLAGLCFLVAALGLFWSAIPAGWWPALVAAGAIASGLLSILFFGVWMIPPILLDVVLLLGVFVLHWSVAGLHG